MWDVTSPVTDAVSKVKFLLTHPVWDVTVHHVKHVRDYPISTHTSRVGCDNIVVREKKQCGDFYSHIPCGM